MSKKKRAISESCVLSQILNQCLSYTLKYPVGWTGSWYPPGNDIISFSSHVLNSYLNMVVTAKLISLSIQIHSFQSRYISLTTSVNSEVH